MLKQRSQDKIVAYFNNGIPLYLDDSVDGGIPYTTKRHKRINYKYLDLLDVVNNGGIERWSSPAIENWFREEAHKEWQQKLEIKYDPNYEKKIFDKVEQNNSPLLVAIKIAILIVSIIGSGIWLGYVASYYI